VSLRLRNRPAQGFIKPCLPSSAKKPPSGADWLHEIKHDGFRIMARRDANGVRLISRNGNDVTSRFPLIATAVAALPAQSCLIDGEAIVRDKTGLAVFDLIRGYRAVASAVLCAFDLLELDAKDLRRKPIEFRKSALNTLLRRQQPGIVFDQHYKARGETIFRLACELGCEGILSKRLGSPYRSGRSRYWVKIKNSKAPAVRREAEEDWGR
jgi:bifunctional non-homologous end joining protein LigD